MEMNQTQRILYEAACLIDTPEKWCKGWLSAADVAHCALGACYAVTARGVPRALGLAFNGAITTANDAPDTTHADVMMAFAFAWAFAGDEA